VAHVSSAIMSSAGVPLDKSEGGVKGIVILGGAQPPLVLAGGPLKPGFDLSGDVHTSQTWANEQTRLSSCHGD